jgi:hypothetical protein
MKRVVSGVIEEVYYNKIREEAKVLKPEKPSVSKVLEKIIIAYYGVLDEPKADQTV